MLPTQDNEPLIVGLLVLNPPKSSPKITLSIPLVVSIKGLGTEGDDPRPSSKYSYPINPH